MAPKFQGQLSLFPAPHPPRTPLSVSAARDADARPKEDGTWRQYPYFTSGAAESDKAVIFVGGLTNGLAGVPYTTKLSTELGKAGWKLVQPHWTSAYDGYGTSSLDADVGELSALVEHIRKEDGIKTVVVMGHSTGSQDVIHYLSHNPSSRASVQGGIMQAPASDREYFSGGDDPGVNAWNRNLVVATRMMEEGKGDQVMDDKACEAMGIKITAYRLWSLLSEVGDDDYFSENVPASPDGNHPHPLESSFGKLSAPALALFSSGDAPHQRGDIKSKLKRWEEMAGGRLVTNYVEGASHDVVEPDAQERMCATIVDWLRTTIS